MVYGNVVVDRVYGSIWLNVFVCVYGSIVVERVCMCVW